MKKSHEISVSISNGIQLYKVLNTAFHFIAHLPIVIPGN